jgi:hypothetical protein
MSLNDVQDRGEQWSEVNLPEGGKLGAATPSGPRSIMQQVGGALRAFADVLPALQFNTVEVPTEFIPSTFYATDTMRQAAGFNVNRSYLFIQNNGVESIFITFGTPKRSSGRIEITPGGFYEPLKAPVSAVYISGDSTVVGNPKVTIVEGVRSTLMRDK